MSADLIRLITRVSRTVVLSRYRPDSCIATARVIIDVAGYFGITATAQAVSVSAFNAKAAVLYKARVPVALWPHDAHSVGITGGKDAGPEYWNGHLVVLAGPYLVDGSLDQMSRPARGLKLSPAVVEMPAREWPASQALNFDAPGGVLLSYSKLAKTDYRTSRNWSSRDPNIRHVTRLAIEGVRRRENQDH